jgi:hypothetical protein
VRNPVDNQIVLRRSVEPNAVKLEVFRDDFAATPVINLLNYCLRKGFFPAYQNSHTLHLSCVSFLPKTKENTCGAVACQTHDPRLQFGSP